MNHCKHLFNHLLSEEIQIYFCLKKTIYHIPLCRFLNILSFMVIISLLFFTLLTSHYASINIITWLFLETEIRPFASASQVAGDCRNTTKSSKFRVLSVRQQTKGEDGYCEDKRSEPRTFKCPC